jgi:uncharacterized membrane protein YebE (DUF533 family)
MIDVNKLLSAVLTGNGAPDPRREVAPRPGAGGGEDFLSRNAGMFGGGALAGGLAGLLLNSKHVRKHAGTALQVGAAAVLGGLAYKAYQDYRAGRPILPQGLQDAVKGMLPQDGSSPVPAPATGPVFTAGQQAPEHTATLLLRAMIASAMADGRLDDIERRRLVERVEASALSFEERQYLEGLIARPDRPAALAAAVRSPEEAAEVYLAAFIAVDADTADERAWLDELASRLGLEPALKANLEAAGTGALGQAA